MSRIYRALLLKHLKDYDDPHQTGIAEIKAELAVQEKTVTLTGNISQVITLDSRKNTLDYQVDVEMLEHTGDVKGFIVSDKQLNGFKLEYSGSATSVIVKCRIRGGVIIQASSISTDLRINLTEATTISLNIFKNDNSTMIIDWGDGGSDHYIYSGTGTSPTHAYAGSGEYIIKIRSAANTFYFDNFCLGDTVNNELLTAIRFGENYGNTIGLNAFNNCTALTSINIPENAVNIRAESFRNCITLTTITLPEGVTAVGYYTFYNCTSLVSVTLPETLTSIGISVFWNCTSLPSITIPESLINIGVSAFNKCRSLTTINIPEGLTSIGDDAFNTCISLESCIFAGNTPITFGVTVFANTASNFKIYYNPEKSGWTTPT